MSDSHEAFVASRFDTLHGRFRPVVERDDYRLRAILQTLGPIAGLRLLDLGCGKGRFALRLRDEGAEVIGLDRSAEMLAASPGLPRVQATARRLPFRNAAFDAVIAVEVVQHLTPSGLRSTLIEARRVLRSGGRLLILDRNLFALDAGRPWLPRVAVKWLDERRGRWMYGPGDPVRERWFLPSSMRTILADCFAQVQLSYLLAPDESNRAIFRAYPPARSMVLWSAQVAGGRDG